MRSAKIAPGKTLQAIEFATGIVEYSKKYEGVADVNIYLDSFGEIGTMRWMADYDNLAALEKVADQIRDDQEWFKKVEQMGDLFIEGSINDIVMRSL
jgi:hypothetical protein